MNELSDQRPSPDALLDEARREKRGKLKIFLGAAPGVGKTFAMLRSAHTRKTEGIDVVVGVVETHQRSETENLVGGLELIPRLKIDYRGIDFHEMNLDRVLERRPKLVLVDELAHSNIPGTRHPKRYQDVEELLDAGIDVYSTLNVQHIESLNDIVARITGVTVRETVPDGIVHEANSIELIDLTPEELLQRLNEGKVYIPEQARLAMNRFFTPGNLTALRELALRQAAERVDAQMASYMRTHAIAGPWPASERIMVCVTSDTQAPALIRTAKRSAERRQAPWLALYIETHNHSSLSDASRAEISHALHLAESLGGETMTTASDDVAGEIIRVATERNVNVIIIGKTTRSLWSRMQRPSVAMTLLERGGAFDILIMSGKEGKRPKSKDPRAKQSRFSRIVWSSYAEATTAVGIATIIASGVRYATDLPTLSLIYLITVMLISVDRGFSVSFYASVLSFLAFDFFFTTPRFSLMIERHEDFISLAFFLVAATVASLIGDRLQKQIEVTQRSARRTQSLYDFNKILAAAATIDAIADAIVNHVATTLKVQAALLFPKNDRPEIAVIVPEGATLDTASIAATDWAWQHGKPAGLNSDTLPGAAFYSIPLRTNNETMGVLAVRPLDGLGFSPDQEHLLSNLASQSAVAIQRSRLSADIEGAHLQTETERLRASLLSSISYDLRTPLVAIMGATTILRDYWEKFDDQARRDLFATIEDEADRLNRFVQNLLDMTKLVSGALKIKRQATDIEDLVGSALTKLRKQLQGRALDIDIPTDLPSVEGDFSILERVLLNVIDNASKYSPSDQPITIVARREAHYIRITVTDRGPGIPEEERDRVFDMFYRVKANAGPATGAGLGLAICRGFIEAHGGRISAQTGADGIGTQIVIRLPLTSSLLPADIPAQPTT